MAILRAATELFARGGYRDASLASVADADGLTRPGCSTTSRPNLTCSWGC